MAILAILAYPIVETVVKITSNFIKYTFNGPTSAIANSTKEVLTTIREKVITQ